MLNAYGKTYWLGVAPFTGAWIEMGYLRHLQWLRWSHPSRVRGLKFHHSGCAPHNPLSHPSRVRGLKSPTRRDRHQDDSVAPFTGAWIEMPGLSSVRPYPLRSHPSRVRGLKFKTPTDNLTHPGSHPSRVRGLKYDLPNRVLNHSSRTLHGCVD